MDMTSLNTDAAQAQEVDIAGLPIAPAKPPLPAPALLDRIEQAVIITLWVWLVWRVVGSAMAPGASKDGWLLLISETSVMIFTVIRRPTQAITMDIGNWMLAITATAAPLLIRPGYDMFPQVHALGVALVLAGNIGQAAAKLSLRRSFGIAPANRGVKVDGAYRFVRHPMYAGYLLVHIGILVLMPSAMNLMVYAVGWGAQIRRLLAEEALLGQDPAYAAYMQRVRWHLLPGIF